MKPRPGVRVEMHGTSQVRVEIPLGPWRLNPWRGDWTRPIRTVLISEDGTVEEVARFPGFRYGPWVEPRYEPAPLGPPLFFREVLRQ